MVERYGLGQALGIYSLVVNIAQAVGPFVFSYVLLVGVNNGLTLVLITISVMAFVFYALEKILDRAASKKIKQNHKKN